MAHDTNIDLKSREDPRKRALTFIKEKCYNQERIDRLLEFLAEIERGLMKRAIEEALRRRRNGELPKDEAIFSQVMRIRRRGPDLRGEGALLKRDGESDRR